MVRLCWPDLDELYIKYEDGVVSGPVTNIFSVFMERLRGLNFTIKRAKMIGNLIDSQNLLYDGCTGSIQRNMSDLMLLPSFHFPSPGPGLRQGVVDGFHKIGMLSAYNTSASGITGRTHVMDMVFAFDPGLWILTIVFFFLLSYQLLVSLRVNGKKRIVSIKRTVDAVEASVLKQHSGCMSLMPSIVSVSFVYTLMTMFGFFIGFYLTSMIKTEMVVVQPPVTVESYDDLIASGRRPLWIPLMGSWQLFKDAKQGSKERKIWDIALRMGLNDSFIESDLEPIMKHAMAVVLMKEVSLQIDLIGENGLKETCAFIHSKNYYTELQPLFRYEDSTPELLQGHVYNRWFDEQTRNRIENRTQRAFEAGLLHAACRFMDLSGMFGPDFYAKHTEITDCASNIVTIPHPEYKSADPPHYVSLVWLSIGLICFALTVLLFELYYKN